MEIGALIELSASARKLQWTQKYQDKIGIVIWINPSYSWYKIKWMGDKDSILDKRTPLYEMFSRSHLKYAKRRK
jgi:hypothetical protein